VNIPFVVDLQFGNRTIFVGVLPAIPFWPSTPHAYDDSVLLNQAVVFEVPEREEALDARKQPPGNLLGRKLNGAEILPPVAGHHREGIRDDYA
jgi:hypothetical protein